jgi:hypothetical protein
LIFSAASLASRPARSEAHLSFSLTFPKMLKRSFHGLKVETSSGKLKNAIPELREFAT